VLNLYAGVGGNRKLWDNVEVTAVESEPKIAAVYEQLYPLDTVIVGCAHQYLLENLERFDFVWASPPCQSHSKMMRATRHKLRRYPDMRLYEEILYLQENASCKWVVENVKPYYAPLIPAKQMGRHLLWSNFEMETFEIPTPPDFINKCNVAGSHEMKKWLGIEYGGNLYYRGNHCPAQVLRNCVHPLLGKHVLDAARMPNDRSERP
jgi:DNA (cytosine-5)-methyltransferase 1